MDTLESLKRQVHTASDLHSLVRTMKAMAAVNIRQLEHAVEALADYRKTIQLGLHAVLQQTENTQITTRIAHRHRLGLIVFGSDQGMCGQLNDQIASLAQDCIQSLPDDMQEPFTLAVGSRAAARLEGWGIALDSVLPVANSTSGITPLIQDILLHIDRWHKEQRVERIVVFFGEHTSRAGYQPRRLELLPLDRQWLQELREVDWPTRMLPAFTLPADQLFSSLVRQYLFVSLFRACAESLASENASRLAAMRGAERNIGERINELTTRFHQVRQMAITEELLDIASGFEAMRLPG